MNEVKELLEKLKKDPKAIELLKAAKEPATIEEAADLYVSIGNQLGINVTRAAVLAYLKGRQVLQQKLTENAEKSVKEALGDEALEAVAGGGELACESTYDHNGEWCWASDSCSLVINYYDKPEGNSPYVSSTDDSGDADFNCDQATYKMGDSDFNGYDVVEIVCVLGFNLEKREF